MSSYEFTMKLGLYLVLALLTMESHCGSYNFYNTTGLYHWIQSIADDDLSKLRIEFSFATHNGELVFEIHIRKTQMEPRMFFNQARTLAFDSYSNYMGSIFRPPRTDSQNLCRYGMGFGVDCLRNLHHYRYYIGDRLRKVADWLQKQNPSWYKHRYESSRHNGFYYRYKRYFALTSSDNRNIYHKNYYDNKLSDEAYVVVLEELKIQLLRGFEPTKLSELKELLNKHLKTDDFDQVIKKIYGNHVNKVKTSTKSMLPFYVKEEKSTTHGLMDADVRKLLLDVIAAANGMNPQCTYNECDIGFQDIKDFHDRQLMTSLPMEMTSTQKEQAMKGMEFIIKSKMDSDKTKAMLSSFVQGSSRGFDVGAICFALKNYKLGSKYGGVKYTASELYKNLDCDNHILYPSQLDLTPATTLEPKMSQLSKNTKTAETTSATTSTTMTPTKSTTTQQTTTAEPTKPHLQCGISEVLTRTKSAEESSLLVTPLIVGGHLAGDCRTYPWMARVIGGSDHCGGAILDDWHIMTAAHCVYNKNSVIVYVGLYDRITTTGQEQMFSVTVPDDVFIYPRFNFSYKTDDMAVLKLSKPIDLSLPCAKPVCLDPSFKLVDGMKCNVAGWGNVDMRDEVASRFLRAVTLPIYNGPNCVSTFHSKPDYLHDPIKQLCAGDPVAGGVDSCGGDSGGPLMCQRPDKSWVVVGVTSYGGLKKCGVKAYPGVYANVAPYYDWIQEQLRK